LQVRDLAGQDVGQLNQWGLQFQIATLAVFKEDNNSEKIPDNQPKELLKY